MTSAVAGSVARAAARLPTLVDAAWRRRHDPHARRTAVLALVLTTAALAFGHVVEDYLTGDPLVRWDVELAAWLHDHSSPGLRVLALVVTLAGTVVVLAALTAVSMLALARCGRIVDAIVVGAVAVTIELLNAGLKLAFHRPRPELAYVRLDTFSFPSGHAAGSSAIYGVLAAVVARRLPTRSRIAVGGGSALLVVAIALTRLVLEAHYLSDVLAGVALGTGWAAAWLLARELAGDRAFLRATPAPVVRLLERAARARPLR